MDSGLLVKYQSMPPASILPADTLYAITAWHSASHGYCVVSTGYTDCWNCSTVAVDVAETEVASVNGARCMSMDRSDTRKLAPPFTKNSEYTSVAISIVFCTPWPTIVTFCGEFNVSRFEYRCPSRTNVPVPSCTVHDDDP